MGVGVMASAWRFGQIGRVLSFLAVIGVVACGSSERKPSVYVTPWRLNGTETVSVSARDDKSNLRFLQPMSGRGGGALYGAGSAAAGALDMGTGCDGMGCALIVPIVLGAAVVGGTVGAATSHSKAETEAASASLMAALKAVEPSKDIMAHLIGSGRVRPDGPNLRRGSSGQATLKLTTRVQFTLTGSRVNPDMIVILYVSGTLRSGTPVTVNWTHRSPPYNYWRLAENDAALFKKVLRAEASKMAKTVRSELSLAVTQRVKPR